MAKWIDMIGTSLDYLRIGLTNGFRIKKVTNGLEIRNAADSAYAEISASKANITGDDLILNSDAAGAGNDRTLTLSRNATMAANLQLIFPGAKGTDGQMLVQKAGTGAGIVELEYATPGGASGVITVDTTSLAFGSASPVSMFNLPSTAIINMIEVVIDTAFNGTPTMSVGISGTASKYVAATQVDLTQAAATVFQISPGLPAPGSTEALIITYAAGGASAGAARVLVYYSTPV